MAERVRRRSPPPSARRPSLRGEPPALRGHGALLAARPPRPPWLAPLVVVLLLVGMWLPALAQVGNPSDVTSNPHPAMPWSGITNPNRIDYGDVVRHIQVPPRQVVIEVPVPVPEGLPPRRERQVVTVPGYLITETTTGFYYPERWTLERLNAGVYQWRKLPAQFKRKPPSAR